MSWRFLIVFVVVCMAGSALAGVVAGNWLVNEAPVVEAGTRTNLAGPGETVLDASGRPLAATAPQPLINGTLGVPEHSIQAMWEIQPVSLFDSNLDPMVTLAIGNQTYTIGDVLNQAGSGLGTGAADISTIDVTQGNVADPIAAIAAGQSPASTTQPTQTASTWQQALADAVKACDNVNFFRRPGCVETARQKYCAPNQAWGSHALCPSQQSGYPSGA